MENNTSNRRFLLGALARFIREASAVSGVVRIAVVGSLTTEKPTPKDADVLVTVRDDADVEALARLGRKLKGTAQTHNLGADIFLASDNGHYIGRTCSFKQCHPRSTCAGTRCGAGNRICNDFDAVRLADGLIAQPPLEVWPDIVVRVALPIDVREVLIQ